MGQRTSTPAVVDVGLPGGDDENKTRLVSDVGGMFGMSGVSKFIQPSQTRLVGVGAAGVSARQKGPDVWVDATVSTPLFPHGRPAGVERQARHQKRVSKFRVFSDGAVFEGPEALTIPDTHDLCKAYERVVGRPITRVTIGDKRAHQVLVAWSEEGKFWAIPSRQSFSRHLGVCLILGDKSARGPKHSLRVGDIIRLGSVGLLVSEICVGPGQTEVVSQEALDLLQDKVNTVPHQVLAPLRKEFEEGGVGSSSIISGSAVGGQFVPQSSGEEEEEEDDDDTHTQHSTSTLGSGAESHTGDRPQDTDDGAPRYQCYICMDSEEEEGDVLIAPCHCKGSTALVHVKCLQRLLSTGDARGSAVTSTKHQNHTCKICKARYKTHVKLPDGTLVPLLNASVPAPYISLVVVTRHESHPDLFNQIFHMSFAEKSELSLGRSQGCDLIISYRTVSTRHATISFSRGEFQYQDAKSSNGSLLYLRGPLEVPFNRTIRLRVGRSILSLRARSRLPLSSIPRKTAASVVQWFSGKTTTTQSKTEEEEGGGGGQEKKECEGTSGALLKEIYLGKFAQADDSLISENLVQEGIERLAWHLDSSSSSLVGDEPERPQLDGYEDEIADGVWTVGHNTLHLNGRPNNNAAEEGKSGETSSGEDGGDNRRRRRRQQARQAGLVEEEDDDDDDIHDAPPPPRFMPEIHSEVLSHRAPSTRIQLQRTRSSRM